MNCNWQKLETWGYPSVKIK